MKLTVNGDVQPSNLKFGCTTFIALDLVCEVNGNGDVQRLLYLIKCVKLIVNGNIQPSVCECADGDVEPSVHLI